MKVRLGDVGQIITGNTPKTSNVENYSSKDIAFIKPSDIQEDGLTILSGAGFYISEHAREKARILNRGCILVTCIGIVGKVAINSIECAFNQQINAIVPDAKKCDTKFIAYAIQNQQRRLQDIANAAVVPILNKTQFSNIEIPLPPLDEQRRIAAVLDKVSNLIAKRRAQLDKLDELVKARFVEMFGDPINNSKKLSAIPLGKVCRLKAGITTPADIIHARSEEFTVPCYGGNGIRGYVQEATQEGTYPIIGRQGALCGNVQLATGKFHATEHAVLVSPLIEMNIIWIYYLLRFMDLYRYHTGAAQPGLAVKALNAVEIPMVNIESQNKFADFARQVCALKLTIQQSLDKLEILKKMLMQEYFG